MLHRIYKDVRVTSTRGQEALERKAARAAEERAKHEEEKRVLRAEAQRHAREAEESRQQSGTAVTSANFARRHNLSDVETQKLTNLVENARRAFQPTPAARSFDPFAACDQALSAIRPEERRIVQGQAALTREQRIAENEVYTETLRKLGLSHPASGHPGGVSGLG